MGEVWLADDTQLPRRVAVKLLPRHLAEDSQAVKRLLSEARATAQIEHPAVATVYEAGEHDGQPYLVMQRFDGETLDERLERGAMPVGEVLAMATAVADALAEMHALGIIHRDLKPSNIMLTPRGPKVLDFGLARTRVSPALTAEGSLVGTPVTMSPEQINGLPPDNRTDLWALGVVLYQALTGALPFVGETYQSVFQQVLHCQPEPPSARCPEAEGDTDYIVMKLLRKDPGHRYGRAEDLLSDLANCQQVRSDQPTVSMRLPTTPVVPRLAVLPFEVLSSEADDALLGIGLVEDLIVDLTRVEGLHVASRAEVAVYADRTVPPRTLARELSVEYVVTGSVRRLGNRARISAQLVRASDGHILWAERFDRTLEDLFGVQEEVSHRIVEALQVALKPGEREILERAPAKSTEAYALYLRGRELLDRSRDENLRAERLLVQALEIDDEFALAHAALGECYAQRGLKWWAGLEVAEKAVACARRALEIEPGLPDAYYVEMLARRLEGDPKRTLAALERVLETNPENGQAREWAAWSYLSLGRPLDALPILEQLTDRYAALGYLASCYLILGRDEDAVRTYRLLRERLVEGVRRDPETVHERSLLGVTLVRLEEAEKGIEQAELAVALAPDDGRIRYNAACAYALAGQSERAIEHLEKGIENLPSYIADWPRRDPDLDAVREHPEFKRLFGSSPPE